MKRRKNS